MIMFETFAVYYYQSVHYNLLAIYGSWNMFDKQLKASALHLNEIIWAHIHNNIACDRDYISAARFLVRRFHLLCQQSLINETKENCPDRQTNNG